MAAPLSEKGVELERTLGYFQFNRDCDDEEVRIFHTCLTWCFVSLAWGLQQHLERSGNPNGMFADIAWISKPYTLQIQTNSITQQSAQFQRTVVVKHLHILIKTTLISLWIDGDM